MDVPMELSRILITELGDQQVIFLREQDGERSFPILIGTHEALAIDRRLKGLRPPRPLTHELLADVIQAMGGTLRKIVVSDLREHTFIATLHIQSNGDIIQVDARPSDAIALGVAMETPIYVADHVLEEVFREPQSKEDRLELLRQRMLVLGEQISELASRLDDEDFREAMPQDQLERYERQLSEMRREYEAIEDVLRKLG